MDTGIDTGMGAVEITTGVSATNPSALPADGELPAFLWERILQEVKTRKVVLHAYLLAALREEYLGGVLHIYFDPVKGQFHKERSQEGENVAVLKEAAEEVLGVSVSVSFAFVGGGPDMDPIDKAIALFGRDVVKLE